MDALSTIFWVFGMTRPGIEPRPPRPLMNTLDIYCFKLCLSVAKQRKYTISNHTVKKVDVTVLRAMASTLQKAHYKTNRNWDLWYFKKKKILKPNYET